MVAGPWIELRGQVENTIVGSGEGCRQKGAEMVGLHRGRTDELSL